MTSKIPPSDKERAVTHRISLLGDKSLSAIAPTAELNVVNKNSNTPKDTFPAPVPGLYTAKMIPTILSKNPDQLLIFGQFVLRNMGAKTIHQSDAVPTSNAPRAPLDILRPL